MISAANGGSAAVVLGDGGESDAAPREAAGSGAWGNVVPADGLSGGSAAESGEVGGDSGGVGGGGDSGRGGFTVVSRIADSRAEGGGGVRTSTCSAGRSGGAERSRIESEPDGRAGTALSRIESEPDARTGTA